MSIVDEKNNNKTGAESIPIRCILIYTVLHVRSLIALMV